MLVNHWILVLDLLKLENVQELSFSSDRYIEILALGNRSLMENFIEIEKGQIE